MRRTSAAPSRQSPRPALPQLRPVLFFVLVIETIGAFQGFVSTKLAIPTFVVTLAGLLTWQGAQLKVLGSTGTLNITDPTIVGLTGTFYSDAVDWGFALIGVIWLTLAAVRRRARRAARGLPVEPVGLLVGVPM